MKAITSIFACKVIDCCPHSSIPPFYHSPDIHRWAFLRLPQKFWWADKSWRKIHIIKAAFWKQNNILTQQSFINVKIYIFFTVKIVGNATPLVKKYVFQPCTCLQFSLKWNSQKVLMLRRGGGRKQVSVHCGQIKSLTFYILNHFAPFYKIKSFCSQVWTAYHLLKKVQVITNKHANVKNPYQKVTFPQLLIESRGNTQGTKLLLNHMLLREKLWSMAG